MLASLRWRFFVDFFAGKVCAFHFFVVPLQRETRSKKCLILHKSRTKKVHKQRKSRYKKVQEGFLHFLYRK